MKVITQIAARAQGLKWYFTGKPCKHGHVAKRRVGNGACNECEKKNSGKWAKANPDRVRESERKRREWRKANPYSARIGAPKPPKPPKPSKHWGYLDAGAFWRNRP